MICERWATVVVPFPFTDKAVSKRRPALVISHRDFNAHGHSVLAMITTKADHPWPGDIVIGDLDAAGLPQSCIIRWKLFTLDNRLIVRIAGRLGDDDRFRAEATLRQHLLGP